VRVVNKVTQQ